MGRTRVYTRAGDRGETCLAGGRRVEKTHPRIAAYGSVDELNAAVGLALVSLQPLEGAVAERLRSFLCDTQSRLFELGSELACLPQDLSPATPCVETGAVEELEAEIDSLDADLPALTSFILPGGGAAGAHLHFCRTVCRRAELTILKLGEESELRPEAVRYINRLSDYLFVAARAAAHASGAEETAWAPK